MCQGAGTGVAEAEGRLEFVSEKPLHHLVAQQGVDRMALVKVESAFVVDRGESFSEVAWGDGRRPGRRRYLPRGRQ
jgi:hypothetical protein